MLYISTMEDLEKSIGVQKKIYSQAKVFSSYTNEDTFIVGNKKGTIYLVILGKSGFIRREKILFKTRNIFEKTFYYKKLFAFIDEIVKKDQCGHIAYLRCVVYDKYLYEIIKKLKFLGYKVIIEIPTSTFLEEYLRDFSKGWYKIISFYLYGKSIYQLADLIISIGEIASILKTFKDKVLLINNGISLSEIPKINLPKFEKELNLIGVANVLYWHGYDRVITGLASYYQNSGELPVYFHVVGTGTELPKLKKLTKKLKVGEYVIFHGLKTGRELDELFNKCHVAIGSLGNHRKKNFIESSLKNREYCARGIPFIVSSYDKDIPENFRYVYRVPPNDEPIDIFEVIKFYESIKNDDYITHMRNYAKENLIWDVKLKPVIKKINEMFSKKGKHLYGR